MSGQAPPNGEEFGSVAVTHDDHHNFHMNRTKPSLDQLPTELILETIKYLSMESQAALCFTNKRLKHVIGTDPWKKLKTQEYSTARKDFIRGLERDLLNWKFCCSCELLHPTQLIPSLWKQVESKKYVIVGAPRTLPYFRIYNDHLKAAFQRQIRGKPFGCCLEIFKQTFPPTFPKTKSAQAVLKDVATTIAVSISVNNVNTRVRWFRQQSSRFYISWKSTFSFNFFKPKTDDQVIKLVELLQADGFRICRHLVWGVPKEHGTECISVNNFVWGRFAQPECHRDIPALYCALCETTFDIIFIHGPVTYPRLVKKMCIIIGKTWSVIREDWPYVSSSTEILVGTHSFEDSLHPCDAQYEVPPTSCDLPADKQQPGQTGQSKRRSWRDRMKLNVLVGKLKGTG